MIHNSKTTRLVYPLALWTNNVHLQPSKYRTLFHNSKRTRSVYPSALPLQPKVGFIPVNLSTCNSTRRNIQTYLQNFNWLLQRRWILERNDEKEKRKQFSKRGKMAAKCQTCWMGVSARAAHALSGLSRQVSAYRLPQLFNLGGMSMNIQRKNSAHHFRMQSEREQTLVV